MKQGPKDYPALRLGVIGGGSRCRTLFDLLESGELAGLPARIVAVADPDGQAAGMRYAKAKGIFTTSDFRQLPEAPEVNRVVELAGREDLLRELAGGGPRAAQVADLAASRLIAGLVDMEQRLRRTEEECSLAGSLTRTLTSAWGEGVMVLDPSYLILAVNPAALERAGLAEDQAVGRYCFQVSHQSLGPCDSPETPCPVKRTLSSGEPAYAIHQHIDASGESHYCNVSSYPVLNQEGQVVRVIEIFRDITQDLNVQVERRTRLIKEDLARLVREDKLISLGKLVASVAHEINNPIASIFNFSKLIGKSIKDHAPTEPELVVFRKWLDLTVREAQRCGKIVSNLLTFARQQGLEPRQISLGELLDTILTLVRHRMDLADVDLCLELAEPELTLWGDYNQLQQCFTNLIFNALEAMPGGGQLTIRGGPAGGGRVWVSVTDTGHGIASEHLPYIFEPFFSTKEQGQGVGLGLSMVHGIIRDHGGDIQVESPPGQGATFTVTLPASGPPPARPPEDGGGAS